VSQPNWQSILDNLASENKTMGEVPTGDLFTVTPNPAYTGDLDVKVYLANTDDLSKAYQYLNMKLYMEGSVSANETPDYQLLTLDNGQAGFTLQDIAAVEGTWTQTSQADFDDGTLFQVDAISPGDVILDTFTDNVTDTFDNEDLIAASANVTVADGQVKLTAAGAGVTETLRPNVAGDNTSINIQEPLSGEHWEKVDEDDPHDSDSTFVATENWDWLEDLYNIDNHVTGSGSTNYVKVYAVAKREPKKNPVPSLYIQIKTNGEEDESGWNTLTTDYATYSYQWNTNPQTGNPWTWDEIDALQIGVGIRRPKSGRYTRVTQVYAEVNYSTIKLCGEVPTGDLFDITPDDDYTGDLAVKVYLTNTGD